MQPHRAGEVLGSLDEEVGHARSGRRPAVHSSACGVAHRVLRAVDDGVEPFRHRVEVLGLEGRHERASQPLDHAAPRLVGSVFCVSHRHGRRRRWPTSSTRRTLAHPRDRRLDLLVEQREDVRLPGQEPRHPRRHVVSLARAPQPSNSEREHKRRPRPCSREAMRPMPRRCARRSPSAHGAAEWRAPRRRRLTSTTAVVLTGAPTTDDARMTTAELVSAVTASSGRLG